MKSKSSTEDSGLAGRLKELEHFTGSLVADGQAEEIPTNVIPLARVPVPRRARVFLRGGEGHGAFAELTLTAPARSTLD